MRGRPESGFDLKVGRRIIRLDRGRRGWLRPRAVDRESPLWPADDSRARRSVRRHGCDRKRTGLGTRVVAVIPCEIWSAPGIRKSPGDARGFLRALEASDLQVRAAREHDREQGAESDGNPTRPSLASSLFISFSSGVHQGSWTHPHSGDPRLLSGGHPLGGQSRSSGYAIGVGRSLLRNGWLAASPRPLVGDDGLIMPSTSSGSRVLPRPVTVRSGSSPLVAIAVVV